MKIDDLELLQTDKEVALYSMVFAEQKKKKLAYQEVEFQLKRLQKAREALQDIASGQVPEHVENPSDGGEPPRYGWAVDRARRALWAVNVVMKHRQKEYKTTI